MNTLCSINNKPQYLLLTLEFPPFKGGIANYLYGLCNYLPAKNLIALASKIEKASAFDSSIDFRLKRVPVPVLNVKYANSALALLIFLYYTLLMVFRQRIKGIFCNHYIPLGVVGYIIKTLFGIPYGLIFHGGELFKLPERGFKRRLAIQVVKGASKLIVNSNYTKRELMKLDLTAEKQIVVLHPGIVYSKFNSRPEANGKNNINSRESALCLINHMEKITNDRRRLLTVARLVPYKGIDMVIRSLRHVINEIPDLIYLVIGEGRDRERLETIVKDEGLDDYVKFLGRISDEETIHFYKICDVFLLVSRVIKGEPVEGFGIAFLEANACGKPVIGGNSGGIPDAVLDGATGFLVDPNDTVMIAGKIIALLVNRDLAKQYGAFGRERVERYFDWEKRGAELENVLKF